MSPIIAWPFCVTSARVLAGIAGSPSTVPPLVSLPCAVAAGPGTVNGTVSTWPVFSFTQ